MDILHLAAPCRTVPVTFTLDRAMTTLPKLVNLIRRMYLRTVPGRVALLAFLLLVAIPVAHVFGGAPSMSELRIVEGIVNAVQTREGHKGSVDVELTVTGGNGPEQLRYFVNSGDDALARLVSLRGRAVRAWVKSTYESRIYQLVSDGRKVIDYETRNRQLSGDPKNLFIYFCAVLGLFALLSIKRYSEETL